jgi:hypothetical protein
MDFRKIIGFGKSSFVISLPKGWTAQNKLQKGDVVYLNEDGSTLVLSAKEKAFVKEPKMITIKTDGKSTEHLQAEITTAYLENYDTLEIKGYNLQEKAHEIKKIISNLAGIELLEQDGCARFDRHERSVYSCNNKKNRHDTQVNDKRLNEPAARRFL